jgi:hypothetical protein
MLISLAHSRSHGFMKWSEGRWAADEEANQPCATAALIAIAPIAGDAQA